MPRIDTTIRVVCIVEKHSDTIEIGIVIWLSTWVNPKCWFSQVTTTCLALIWVNLSTDQDLLSEATACLSFKLSNLTAVRLNHLV